MKYARALKAIFIVLVLWPTVGAARPVQGWAPEELEPRADLICNGKVLSVKDEGVNLNSSYPGVSPSSMPERMMVAKIKVLHVFKGTAPGEIEFRYRVSAPSGIGVNGPQHVFLQKGERYRFFLQPGAKTGQYADVLDGDIDDNFAVEQLCPAEPDDHSFLKKDEAIKIALALLKVRIPKETFDPRRTQVECNPEPACGAEWSVTFYNTPGERASYSYVTVREDGTIDEQFSATDQKP